MSKEIKSTENLLLLRLGRMVKENVELEQRVHQLTDEYNEVVRQLRGLEKRADEDPERQTLGEMSQMRNICAKFEVENVQLKEYVKVVDTFIKDKELYMPKGICCPYLKGNPAVASNFCLECAWCLRVLEGSGVVCRLILGKAKIVSAKPCPPQQSNS